MIGIARQTDYAARIVLHLACLEPGARVPIAEIASKRLLPVPFVRRLVGKLVAAGLLASARGMHGGVRLACPASKISLLDVVQSLEGPIVLNRCVDNPNACPLTETCPVQRAWSDATRTLEDTLRSITFNRLASRLERGVTMRGYSPRRPANRRRR